jgi:hypothetical protein
MSKNDNKEKIADVLFDDDEDEAVINKIGEQKEIVNFDIMEPNNNQNGEINFSISKKKLNKKKKKK